MFRFAKIVLAYVACACSLSLPAHAVTGAEEDSTRFSFKLRFYNHSELVYKGAATYHITSDYIGVSRRNLFDKEDRAVFSSTITKALSDSILALGLEQLANFYNNPCVMSTSGDELFISLEHGGLEKRVYLHHYYLPVVARLIALINTAVPEENRLRYLDSSVKQDCP